MPAGKATPRTSTRPRTCASAPATSAALAPAPPPLAAAASSLPNPDRTLAAAPTLCVESAPARRGRPAAGCRLPSTACHLPPHRTPACFRAQRKGRCDDDAAGYSVRHPPFVRNGPVDDRGAQLLPPTCVPRRSTAPPGRFPVPHHPHARRTHGQERKPRAAPTYRDPSWAIADPRAGGRGGRSVQCAAADARWHAGTATVRHAPPRLRRREAYQAWQKPGPVFFPPRFDK
ncbi:hypothetical protein C8Q77DRAFT_1077280 [Trametes polyzona]|nr:hypothetical protein C8Q77DRAFT_1077280 [Trametes polyzona]